MSKVERVNVPVSKEQKKELKKKAMKAGYMSLADYMRDKGLDIKKEV